MAETRRKLDRDFREGAVRLVNALQQQRPSRDSVTPTGPLPPDLA
jgi:hypothetical protein